MSNFLQQVLSFLANKITNFSNMNYFKRKKFWYLQSQNQEERPSIAKNAVCKLEYPDSTTAAIF